MPETDTDNFIRLADPFRPELLAHCYRMLGSVDDAEDLVQETYLRAWRAYGDFEGRSSLRTWLYRIATSACLTALEHRSRRFLPSGLGAPSDDPDAAPAFGVPEVRWVQPLPDSVLDLATADPASIVASRGSVRLALVAALQHLPPKQRAVLLLRDVLAWRAAEVAEFLGTTTAAVNSALQRARAQLEAAAPHEDAPTEPLDLEQRVLLDQYVKAFENLDIDALVQVLRHDVTLEMPPEPAWFRGREAVSRFIQTKIFAVGGEQRLIRTTANGQPALASYWRQARDEDFHAHAVLVLGLRDGGVASITAFRQPSLFRAFGLPSILGPEVSVASWRG